MSASDSRQKLIDHLSALEVYVDCLKGEKGWWSSTVGEMMKRFPALPPTSERRTLLICSHDDIYIITCILKSIVQGYLPVIMSSKSTLNEVEEYACRFETPYLLSGISLLPCDVEKPDFEVKESDVVVILTSGSSGKPKAVTHSFDSLLKAAEDGNKALNVTENDAFLLSLPLHHISGLMTMLRAAVAGVPLLLPDLGVKIKDLIHDGVIKPTVVSLVPTQLKELMAEKRGKGEMRVILLGGSASEPELVSEAIEAGYPIHTVYGSSETAAFIAIACPEELAENPKAGYKLIDGVEIKSEGGELLVKTDHLFSRYLDDQELTASVFADGFYKTNDLCDISEKGELKITGRKNRFIISGGVNIDPVEIEAVIKEFPAIDEVFVFGVPNEKWGEAVAALLVANKDFEFQDLHAFLRTRITPYKIPKYYRLVDAIPLTAIGKYDPVVSRLLLFER